MKVGENVIIKKNLKVGEQYGVCVFSEDMKGYLGKLGKVSEVNKHGYFYLEIEKIPVEKKFTEDMVNRTGEVDEDELVSEETPQAVTVSVVADKEVKIKEASIEDETDKDTDVDNIVDTTSEVPEETPEIPEIPEIQEANPVDAETNATAPKKEVKSNSKPNGKKGK